MEVDEIVTLGEYQNEKSYHIENRYKRGNIEIYSSTTQNPKYIYDQGCAYIGCILPNGHNFLLNENVFVKIRFGETEIEFYAYQPKGNQKAVYYLRQ